ncbi:MAG: response regulator [Cytophagaceae bacterium]
MISCILLIDDDVITNFINVRLLKKMAISEEVNVVLNGEEGLIYLHTYIEKHKCYPELILLDINMPVMDGFHFLEELKKMKSFDFSKTHIAILSTSTAERDKEKASQLNIHYQLYKPLTEEKIRSLLIQMNLQV